MFMYGIGSITAAFIVYTIFFLVCLKGTPAAAGGIGSTKPVKRD